MLVAQILDKFLPITEPWIYSQIKELEKLNVQSKIFCHKIINQDLFHHPDIVSFKNQSFWKINFFRFLAQIKKQDSAVLFWNRILAKSKCDLIHSHFGWAAKKGIDLAKINNLPHLVTFYGSDLTRDTEGKDPISLAYQKKLSQIFSYSKKIICTSNFLKNILLKLNAPFQKIIVWRPGIDLSLYDQNFKKKNKDKITISCIGRFISLKGQKYLISALVKVKKYQPNIEVNFIGDGQELDKCKKLSQSLGLEKNINFLGSLTHQQVINILKQTDIYCQPSITSQDGRCEVLGMSLVEAAACKCPLLASNSGGMPEIVINGFNGFLCKEKNIDQIADRLLLLCQDKKSRERFGKNAYNLVKENFNLKKQIEILKTIYDQSCA